MQFQTIPPHNEPKPKWSRGVTIERYRSGYLLLPEGSEVMTWYRPGDRWFEEVEAECIRRETTYSADEWPTLEDALLRFG